MNAQKDLAAFVSQGTQMPSFLICVHNLQRLVVVPQGQYVTLFGDNQSVPMELQSPIMSELGSSIKVTVKRIEELRTGSCYSGDDYDSYVHQVQKEIISAGALVVCHVKKSYIF